MAKTFRPGLGLRLASAMLKRRVGRGKGPSFMHLLSVRGRKTGKVHTTPVDVMEVGDRRYIVAPYGVTNWVRNARAAGEVTVSRGIHSEALRVTEVGPEEAVSVLRKYIKDIRFTRSYFDAKPDSPDEEIAAEAPKHPVFRLEPLSGWRSPARTCLMPVSITFEKVQLQLPAG
jgi:deazaflavin-dependent oxidoreductase (nitroreductase family)